MFINLDPGSVGIEMPLDELIPFASRHHFVGIDLPLEQVASRPDLDRLEAGMQEADLRFGGFSVPLDFRRDQATCERGMEQLKAWVPNARRLGCDRAYTSVVPGHDELDYSANFDLHVERLAPLAALLGQHEIRLGLEFIGPKTLRDTFCHAFIYTIPQVLELCAAIESRAGANSRVGVLLDCYHWYTSGATEADLLDNLNNQNIVYVHVNDAVAGRSRDQQMDLERELPGATGLVDAATFVRALKTLGYDGPVTAEPFSEELNRLPADEIAVRVVASVRQMLDSA